MKNLSTATALDALRIPTPPLDEQRRIAGILDQADALRAKRRESIAHLDDLTQSIFLDMFGEPDSSRNGSEKRSLSDVVLDLRGGKSLVADDSQGVTKNRVLKISSVTRMSYDPAQSKPIPDSYEPPLEHFVRPGDLIISRANTTELVGALAYVWSTPDNLVLPDKLWRFVFPEPRHVDPLYLWALFQTRSIRRELSARSSGTGGSMKNISMAKLLPMRIPVPPMDQQRRFGELVRRMESLKGNARAHLAELDALFASLQHRAFVGEL